MENPFEFFDRMYCINLVSRVDRWVKVKKEFEKLGILDKVKRFNAIEKRDGRVGCIKSHLEIIKIAKKEKLKNVLILEDDVTFLDNDVLNKLNIALSQLPEKYHMLYLGANLHGQLEHYSENLLKIKMGFSTHAVSYSEHIYDVFIDKYDKLTTINDQTDILDVWLATNIQANEKYNCFLIKPLLATQINDFSDIEKKKVDYSFIEERYKKFVD